MVDQRLTVSPIAPRIPQGVNASPCDNMHQPEEIKDLAPSSVPLTLLEQNTEQKNCRHAFMVFPLTHILPEIMGLKMSICSNDGMEKVTHTKSEPLADGWLHVKSLLARYT